MSSRELERQWETAGGMDLQLHKAITTQVKKDRKMTLEQYIDFIDTHNQSNLTSRHLEQIIRMHAFMLIQRCVPKDEQVEAVKVIDLMEPGRSTLNNNDDVSSCALASITLEEAIKDLSTLKWLECCVTSLQTLNFDQIAATISTATAAVSSISSSKSKSKSKGDSSSSTSRTKIRPPSAVKKLGDLPAAAAAGKLSESVTCKGQGRKRKRLV